MCDNLKFRYYYMDALKVAWPGHTYTESPGLLEEFVLVGCERATGVSWGLRWDAVARTSKKGQSKCRPLLLVGPAGYWKE